MSEAGSMANGYASNLRQSEDTKDLVAAFTTAQQAFKALKKDRNVKVETRGGGSYRFGYATFDELVDMLREAFKDKDLSFMQPVTMDDKGNIVLVTRLQHKSGQWMESTLPLPKIEKDFQAFGSAVTYLTRYALRTMMGVAVDEDDDGVKAQGNKFIEREDRSRPKPHDVEETYAYLTPAGEIDVIRAEGGAPAHKVWVSVVQDELGGVEARHLEAVKAWWVRQQPHLTKLREKHPEAASLAEATYKARVKVLEAEVAEKEPA